MKAIQQLVAGNIGMWTSAIRAKSSGRSSGSSLGELYGAKKLRELILDLAVSGLIVPQHKDDESANLLLDQIEAHRQMLIESGKAKKVKARPSKAEGAKSDALPPGWAWTELGGISEIVRGITFPASEKHTEPSDELVACLRTANVQDEIDWSDLIYVREEFVKREDQIINGNDIVMSMANSRELVGKVAIVDEGPAAKTSFGGFLGVIRPYIVNPRFLLYVMRGRSARNYLTSEASQTTNIANISLAKLTPMPVRLPPLDEQRRIVAKVDELMLLCDQLEAQQADSIEAHQRLVTTLLDALTRATEQEGFDSAWARIAEHFDVLFKTEWSVDQLKQTVIDLASTGNLVLQDSRDEPAANLLQRVYKARDKIQLERKLRQDSGSYEANAHLNFPESWEQVCIGQIGHVLGGKRVPRGYQLLDSPTDHVYIRVTDMKNQSVMLTDLKYVDPSIHSQIAKYVIHKEDVYVTIAGTIGSVGIVPPSLDGMHLTENAAKIVFRELDQDFLVLILASGLVQRQFEHSINQMAQPKLALKEIKKTEIGIPPLAEQKRIVSKAKELMAICDALKSAMQEAQQTQLLLADAITEKAVA